VLCHVELQYVLDVRTYVWIVNNTKKWDVFPAGDAPIFKDRKLSTCINGKHQMIVNCQCHEGRDFFRVVLVQFIHSSLRQAMSIDGRNAFFTFAENNRMAIQTCSLGFFSKEALSGSLLDLDPTRMFQQELHMEPAKHGRYGPLSFLCVDCKPWGTVMFGISTSSCRLTLLRG
jgi:hypothetical protein